MPGKRHKTGQGKRSRKTIGPRRKHAFKQPATVSAPITSSLEECVFDEVDTSVAVEVNFCYLLLLINIQYVGITGKFEQISGR